MIPFDKAVNSIVTKSGGLYRRYSDDIIIIVPTGRAPDIERFVNKQLQLRKLQQNDKSMRFQVKKEGEKLICETFLGKRLPIQYLGFIFDGEKILIRPQTLSRYYQKMKINVKRTVREAKNRQVAQVYTKQLYNRFTHVGNIKSSKQKRNFLTYAAMAYSTMGVETIRKQVSKHCNKLQLAIRKRVIKEDLL